MPNKNLILTVARVAIAAAWADGKITPSERESLKDLMFRLPHIDTQSAIALTADDWNQLEMHIETPVTAEQRQQFVDELKTHLDTVADKKAVLAAVANLVRADESLTDEEVQMAEAIDYYRITREFFNHTSEAEREQFLDVLFAIAAADDGVSHQESENIRRISVSLNLAQRQFMTAKTKFV